MIDIKLIQSFIIRLVFFILVLNNYFLGNSLVPAFFWCLYMVYWQQIDTGRIRLKL